MKIGITDRIIDLGIHKESLEKKGFEFFFLDSTDENTFDTNIIKELDALLVWHAKITEKTIKNLNKCKIVIRYGIGYDQVDGQKLREKGIDFSNNASYCIDEVADTALSMILGFTRNTFRYNTLAKSYNGTSWQENNLDSWRSNSRIVGLIGLGKIGIATALRLKAFGFKIQVYDPYIPDGLCRSLGVFQVGNLKDLLNTSDIVSLHCPLNSETEGFVNKDFLLNMKPDGILVNTARGKMLESLACLKNHLINNPYFKVALDVLPIEPPVSEGLFMDWKEEVSWLQGRLVINPHNAYYSDKASEDQLTHAYKLLASALLEQKPYNVVNK